MLLNKTKKYFIHRHTSFERPAKLYTHLLCTSTVCHLEDLPKAMAARDEWRESKGNLCSQHFLKICVLCIVAGLSTKPYPKWMMGYRKKIYQSTCLFSDFLFFIYWFIFVFCCFFFFAISIPDFGCLVNLWVAGAILNGCGFETLMINEVLLESRQFK